MRVNAQAWQTNLQLNEELVLVNAQGLLAQTCRLGSVSCRAQTTCRHNKAPLSYKIMHIRLGCDRPIIASLLARRPEMNETHRLGHSVVSLLRTLRGKCRDLNVAPIEDVPPEDASPGRKRARQA